MNNRENISEYSNNKNLCFTPIQIFLAKPKGNGSSSLLVLVFIVIVLAAFVLITMYLIGSQGSAQQEGSLAENNVNNTENQASVSSSSDSKKPVSAGSFVIFNFNGLNVDFSLTDGIFSIQKLDRGGKFSILGDYVIKNGSDTVLTIPHIDTDPMKACEQLKSMLGTNRFMSPKGYALPVMTQDGKKVYFTEPSSPNTVKVMENKNDVSVVYTGEGYVASIALDRNGDPYYTLVSDSPFNCASGRANNISVTHVLKGKTLTADRYEELVAIGEGFIVTEFKPKMYFTGAPGSVVIRNVTDGSIVNEFKIAKVLYRDSNYVLFIQSEEELRSREKLIKLDLSTGKEMILLENAWIESIDVTNKNDLVIKYWEDFDFVNIRFTGNNYTYTYKLIE